MRENLESVVNDHARKVILSGKQALVPLKFDANGDIITSKTRPSQFIIKRLTLRDLRFLKVWRESDWDIGKTCTALSILPDVAKKIVRKLQCFREEDAKIKALAEIPTPAWITAKHVENVYEGGRIEDSEHRSLQELAKISGAYKSTAQVNITQNVFNLPKMSQETEAKLKAIADQEADIVEAEVSNG